MTNTFLLQFSAAEYKVIWFIYNQKSLVLSFADIMLPYLRIWYVYLLVIIGPSIVPFQLVTIKNIYNFQRWNKRKMSLIRWTQVASQCAKKLSICINSKRKFITNLVRPWPKAKTTINSFIRIWGIMTLTSNPGHTLVALKISFAINNKAPKVDYSLCLMIFSKSFCIILSSYVL